MHSTSENADIFTERYEICLVFTPPPTPRQQTKNNFLFNFIVKGELQKAKSNFFLGCFSLTFSVDLLGITLGTVKPAGFQVPINRKVGKK